MQDNSDLIIRDCCKAEAAEFDKPDTICITVDVLREIVQRHSPGPCLHQIQEPAAAPAAVAVPELQDMLRELRVQISAITVQLPQSVDCSGVWMAHDKMSAALAATPAAVPAVPKWIDDPHDIEQGQMLNPEWVKAQETAAAPVVLPEPWGYLVEGRIFIGRLLPQHVNSMVESEGFRPTKLFTEQQLGALLATATGLPAQADMPDSFREWFAKNYPADTIIVDPDWHAKSIFRMAQAHARLSAPQAQADAREDSALLDAMERQRIALHPEYEGPWDAAIYSDDGEPIHAGSGSTPREAIRAAIAAAKGEDQ